MKSVPGCIFDVSGIKDDGKGIIVIKVDECFLTKTNKPVEPGDTCYQEVSPGIWGASLASVGKARKIFATSTFEKVDEKKSCDKN